MSKCIIEGCNMTSKKNKVSCFRIPNVESSLEVSRAWMKFAKTPVREEFEALVTALKLKPLSERRFLVSKFRESNRVCQLHFSPDCFNILRYGRNLPREIFTLKPLSVPSINLPNITETMDIPIIEQVPNVSESNSITEQKRKKIGIKSTEPMRNTFASIESDSCMSNCANKKKIKLEVLALDERTAVSKDLINVAKSSDYETSSTPKNNAISGDKAIVFHRDNSNSVNLKDRNSSHASISAISDKTPRVSSLHRLASTSNHSSVPKHISENIEDKKYIVFESQLKKLLSRLRCDEADCESTFDVTENLISENCGTLLTVRMTCASGHEFIWHSQPLFGGIPEENLL